MKTEPIMIFKVYADNRDVSNLECPYGAVTMIPFRATVESTLFTGETLPGAVDVQIENPIFFIRFFYIDLYLSILKHF